MATSKDKLRVAELFAGVGGFRLGLEGNGKKKSHNKRYETVWFNQWEPSTKRQHAHETYVRNFGDFDEYTKIDIASAVEHVPEHDLLVGGFPCQDYSVARNLSAAAGLEGKKGVLWWSIYNILKTQGKKAPHYLMLENVDRLLGSPAKQRGRDFAIILSTLNELGYTVEWRVINAAEYGMPQRRRRTFILGYKKGSNVHKKFKQHEIEVWMSKKGLIQREFPAVLTTQVQSFVLDADPVSISKTFNIDTPDRSPFGNTGIAHEYMVYTAKVTSAYKGPVKTLRDILLEDKDVPDEFYITDPKELERWKYLKGAKNEPRKSASGFEFTYTEGGMAFPDPLDKPSRTIITAEGGKTPSRFKHVVKTEKGLRRLTPVELERLCMFPDNHTEGHADSRRAFFMGNALVVGVIDKLGKSLAKFHFDQ